MYMNLVYVYEFYGVGLIKIENVGILEKIWEYIIKIKLILVNIISIYIYSCWWRILFIDLIVELDL